MVGYLWPNSQNMKTFAYKLIALAALFAAAGCAPRQQEPQRVENVILMIGDGMGVAQITQNIIENDLGKAEMERAQAVGLVRTFSANNRVTDSAAAGTAIATGAKTDNSKLGRDPEGNDLTSILTHAQREGFPTGLVVTVDLFDGTPGAFYAHVHNRKSRDTITVQLLESGIDVAIGGGHSYLDERADGRVLTGEFREHGYNVAFDLSDADSIRQGKLLVVPTPDILPYYTDGRGDYLPRATAKALEVLTNNRKAQDARGFFLMVEGSLIDYAAHDHLTEHLIGEVQDFDRAVKVAFDYADRNPGTLVIVTADHETGGLTLPSNDSDFAASDSGIQYLYSSDGHTASLVPLFAYGTGAEHFSRVIDNTDISKIIARLLEIR